MASNRRKRDRALLDAVLVGDTAQVCRLLAQRGGPDPIDREHGETALMLAGSFNRREIAELLVKAGADVNAQDDYGRTPLMFAPTDEIVTLLLNSGANANSRDGTGRSPLMAAANGSVARALLDRGADVHMRDADGRTALMYAVEQADTDRIRVLLSAGAEPHAEDSFGRTVFSIAADYGFQFLDDLVKPKHA